VRRRQASTDRRAARTRSKLEESLLALVEQHGYEGTNVRALVARAAVGKSTFYEHFRDKDAVLESRLARLAAALSNAASTSGARFAFVEPLLEHVNQHPGLGARLRKTSAGALVLGRFTRLVRAFVADELGRMYPSAARGRLDFASELVTGSLISLLETRETTLRALEPRAAALAFGRLVLPGLDGWLGPSASN
jgi:AcrR family transcriptional regulator